MDIKNLKLMSEEAFYELSQFSGMMSDIRKHCYNDPKGYGSLYNQSNGELSDIQVFNSSPSINTSKFGSRLASLVAPHGTKFYDIAIDDIDESEKQQYQSQIANISDKIFEKITNSNWGKGLNQVMTDMASGTGGWIINYDNDKKQLNFKALNLSYVGFLEGKNGTVDYVFRKLGEFNKSKQLRIYPNIDFGDEKSVELMDCSYPENGKFIYILTNANFDKIYFKEEWETNPFIITRWNQLSGETRGRGILNGLISTIKLVNIMQSDIINASALIINPPIITDKTSIVNEYNIKIQPGGLINLADNQSRFTPMPFGGNLPFAIQDVEMMNKKIEDALLLVNDPLGRVGESQLTATEVNARLEFVQEIVFSYNNIVREFLSPSLNRIIELLEKFNVITSINSFNKGTKKKLKFKYSSPLINIQKNLEVQKMLQTIQVIAQTTGQEAQEYINASIKLNKLPNWVARNLNADMSMINTDDEIEGKLQQFAEAQAQQNMMQLQAQNPALGTKPINTGVIQ